MIPSVIKCSRIYFSTSVLLTYEVRVRATKIISYGAPRSAEICEKAALMTLRQRLRLTALPTFFEVVIPILRLLFLFLSA